MQWSVEPPATSICLTSLSPLQRPPRPTLPNLPWPLLRPHTSSVPASLVIRHPLLARVPSSHDSLDCTPPCTTQSRSRQSVDLSSSLTAELLDWTTSLALHLLSPPLSPDCCVHRTSYKASRASVLIKPKGMSIFRVVCPLEPYPKHISDPGLDLDSETRGFNCKEQQLMEKAMTCLLVKS